MIDGYWTATLIGDIIMILVALTVMGICLSIWLGLFAAIWEWFTPPKQGELK